MAGPAERQGTGRTRWPGLVLGLATLVAGCGDGPTTADTTDPPDLSQVLTLDLDSPDVYADPDWPAHYDAGVLAGVNTPASNPVTDRGATLGRVLFWDDDISLNGTISCASCHMPGAGFSDRARFSTGFRGGSTPAHSMRLANAVFYQGDVMFWDGRARDIEDQTLQPVQDAVEMGFDASAGGLDALVARLEATRYYPVLFEWAFGTPDIDEDRLRRALAQFVRSMVSTGSRFDDALEQAVGSGRPPRQLSGLTALENRGLALFVDPPDRGGAGCAGCHRLPTMALDPDSRSNGLDAGETTVFKAPSLKNVAAAPGYMHDGRFRTLREVVDHYADGIQDGPALDRRLRTPQGDPIRLDLDEADRDALVAFLETLTDDTFLRDPRFSDPFVR